jgi:hypothetical protein
VAPSRFHVFVVCLVCASLLLAGCKSSSVTLPQVDAVKTSLKPHGDNPSWVSYDWPYEHPYLTAAMLTVAVVGGTFLVLYFAMNDDSAQQVPRC